MDLKMQRLAFAILPLTIFPFIAPYSSSTRATLIYTTPLSVCLYFYPVALFNLSIANISLPLPTPIMVTFLLFFHYTILWPFFHASFFLSTPLLITCLTDLLTCWSERQDKI